MHILTAYGFSIVQVLFDEFAHWALQAHLQLEGLKEAALSSSEVRPVRSKVSMSPWQHMRNKQVSLDVYGWHW